MTTAPPHPHRPENEFATQHHVYEPHIVGLPPLGPYIREVWRRRSFAFELSRTKLRAQHFNTVFGQLWLVLNPLFLAGVYFVLVDILRGGSSGPGYFAHLVVCIFAYHLVSDAVRSGTRAVVSGGRLILNSAFPRVLLPFASVISATKKFLPTMLVYIPFHIASGRPIDLQLLWIVPLTGLMIVLASGLAMIVSALQVYFRDLKNIIPYALRLGLYVSPILYFAEEMPQEYRWLLNANPIGQLLAAWSDAIILGISPSTTQLVVACGWAFGLFLAGFLFFVSREREFAVRL